MDLQVEVNFGECHRPTCHPTKDVQCLRVRVLSTLSLIVSVRAISPSPGEKLASSATIHVTGGRNSLISGPIADADSTFIAR